MTREEQDLWLQEYQSWKRVRGPQDDDELHALIVEKFDLNIPRVAVCTDLGHKAPFEFLADLYFERSLTAFAMANRGGAKTFIAALWLWLCATFRPGTEGASVATEQQTMRAYEHLKKIICMDGDVANESKHPDIESSVMRKTIWQNKSLYEIIIATLKGTSGPHPHKVHTDEVEWIDPPVFENSRNMSATSRGILAQDVLTSTRYRAHGLVQAIWGECDDAIGKGFKPPYDRYTWCLFECIENQPNCQVANPDSPTPCECDKVVKGQWESDEPRRFSDYCQGRCARSAGWIPIEQAHKVFQSTTRDVFEAQQLCIKPSTEGLVLAEFDRERHGVRAYLPNPQNGPIFGSVDFGGTNPHAVVLMQLLKEPVLVHGFHQSSNDEPAILLEPGTRVVFDEIYIAEVAPSKLADMVVDRMNYWRRHFPGFRPVKFFYDIQAKGARLEWAHHSPPIILTNYATKDVQLHITYWKDLFEDNKFFVNVNRCPNLTNEIEAWHYPDNKAAFVDGPDQPVKDFDHAVDAVRYGLANIRAIERKGMPSPGVGTGSSGGHGQTTVTGAGATRYMPRASEPSPFPFPRPPDWQKGQE